MDRMVVTHYAPSEVYSHGKRAPEAVNGHSTAGMYYILNIYTAWSIGEPMLARGEYVIIHRFQSKRAQKHIQAWLFPSTLTLKSELNEMCVAWG
jgi:hypothetical protein